MTIKAAMQIASIAQKKRLPAANRLNDWDRIRQDLRDFVKVYQHTKYERGQAQPYWNKLFRCYGITEDTLSKAFEHRLKLGKKNNYVDAFIPGKLIVEHKGSHIQLATAFEQLQGYFGLLPPSEQPRYAVLCNFQKIRLYDFSNVAKHVVTECAIQDLPERAELFKFLLPDETESGFLEQPGIDQKASQAIADLHLVLDADRYSGRELEIFLTRLIFCFFADDTGIFGENRQFHRLLASTKDDGSDLGMVFAQLFQVLNTPHEKRSPRLSIALQNFAYINGQLFTAQQAMPEFDAAMRSQILKCSALNWGNISPAIFGSMFQAVLETGRGADVSRTASRRELGAHYTSESNILRAINPLFLDELRTAIEKAAKNKKALQALHERLARLTIFDPACGCGNFLVVAFQQLRLLEIEIAQRLYGDSKKSMGLLDIREILQVRVNQFYGIEIDESAAHIARVALWITDHQMNLVAAQRLGQTRPSVPLIDSATIVEANALTTDWETVLPAQRCSHIVGNPPFVGYSNQSKAQKDDLSGVCGGMEGAGVLDYVAGWYIKAAHYLQVNRAITVAFVSTNSIVQGEQVSVLWKSLLGDPKDKTLPGLIHLHFGHRTFKWSNDARGVAAVHCVIVGFGAEPCNEPQIFDYSDDIAGEPTKFSAQRLNPYLVDAPTVFIDKRRKPLCSDVPEMIFGSKPTDGGFLLLSQEEADTIRAKDAVAAKYIRPFLGADEFINNLPRYCLWLQDSTAADRKTSPEIQRRMAGVKAMRLSSPKVPTQKLAEVPYLFGEIRQKDKPFIGIPKTSSERRKYVPVGLLRQNVIAGSELFAIPNASPYHFGLLCSTAHNAWMRTVCGRLKSDYRYSNTIVYNNFPWPQAVTAKQRLVIETAAKAILDARKKEEVRCAKAKQTCSLATLYAEGNMPAELLKAHLQLDKAVDAAFGYKGAKDDAARVAFLFERYLELTATIAPVVSTEPAGKVSARKKSA